MILPAPRRLPRRVAASHGLRFAPRAPAVTMVPVAMIPVAMVPGAIAAAASGRAE